MRTLWNYPKSNYLLKILCWLVVVCYVAGCSDEQQIITNNPLGLTRVSVPLSVEMDANDLMTLSGNGFTADDKIVFSGESGDYDVVIRDVAADKLTYTLPVDIPTGEYQIIITRGTDTMKLANLTIYRVYRGNVPDRDGMNVKGKVHCCGTPLAGVVVSDGVEVTTTDSDGCYYLASDKKSGYVFVSLPSGYKTITDGNHPSVFANLSTDVSKIDRNDFSLIKIPADKDYVMLALADMHLAARTYDKEQYQAKFLPDVNAMIAAYKAEGKDVWAVTLGDQSWDAYWYSNNFTLVEAIQYVNQINCPVFHCVGNHDYDPNFTSDWDAAGVWRTNLGPTYYSFNIGNVHYVVLDNIIYSSSSSYKDEIDAEQMDWFKKDLATIADKSRPLVICMHAPLHARPKSVKKGVPVINIGLDNGVELVKALDDFENVTVLSGHMHICYQGSQNEGKIREYNIGAVCATWWWTGHPNYPANVHVCADGAPGGYGVLEVSGNDVSQYYKGLGYSRDYQFRAYDLNTVEITAEKFCPDADDTRLALVPTYAHDFANAGTSNEILVNVWNYGDGWTIEMTENGKPLEVTMVSEYDPLHIVAYEFQRMNVSATPTSAMTTIKNVHMCKATAESAVSTVDIKVTDNFGNVYTESMNRPKEFSYSIK